MRKCDLGAEIIGGLKWFFAKVETDESIDAIRVRRVETPDGPMQVTKKIKWKARRKKS